MDENVDVLNVAVPTEREGILCCSLATSGSLGRYSHFAA
jgi:hypothetical protein